MSERDLSEQNVVLIRSAEDPDEYDGWGGTGWFVPPLGTYPDGQTTPTKDNSTTVGENTPAEPAFEIVKGKASLSFTNDDDDKEASDVTTREVEHDPGKEMNEVSLEHWEQKGESRFGNARRFHPTTREYRPWWKYPRYEGIVISFPLDGLVGTGKPLYVDDALLKSMIKAAEHVWYLRDIIFKTKNPTPDAGEKVTESLNGNYITKREYNNYDFGATLEAAKAISGSGAIAFAGTQPKIPTRVKVDVTTETAAGVLTIVGKDVRGNVISDNSITTSGIGVYYTKKVFSEITQYQGDGTLDIVANIEADELY